MKRPQLPDRTASEEPQLWRDYWYEVGVFSQWCADKDKQQYRKTYYKNYYAKKTQAREIDKLHKLMDKYQIEAHLHKYQPPTPL